MKKFSLALGMFVAMVMAVGLPGTAMGESAPRLGAPTGLSCNFDNDPSIGWDNLSGAAKYSVEVIASYDNPFDGVVELTSHYTVWEFHLNLAFSALAWDHDGDGGIATPAIDPFDVDVQVKGINPPPGRSQNNPFSDLMNCTLPTA